MSDYHVSSSIYVKVPFHRRKRYEGKRGTEENKILSLKNWESKKAVKLHTIKTLGKAMTTQPMVKFWCKNRLKTKHPD